MKYLVLLYDDPTAAEAMSPEERRAIVDEHIAFSRRLREAGQFVYGDPVDDPSSARTVRAAADGGEPIVTDGPFLETKESLGGFYVVDVADADEAVRIAAQVPASPGLAVEVRPIPDV